MRVQPFERTTLPQLLRLVNLHLTAVIPGWALSETTLARELEHDDAQPITDPWVRDRLTLCAVEGDRVIAAAHLLHYGDVPEVIPAYRNVGEISWFLAEPDRVDAATAVFATAEPPVTGLAVRRRVTAYETRLAATMDDAEVGFCDVQPDLTHAGLSPAFGGWGWLTDLQVHEGWRKQGIGRWLVQHAVQWLRLAGCDRIVLAVADENETAGAGRFYRRFGWNVLVREAHGWGKDSEQQHGAS